MYAANLSSKVGLYGWPFFMSTLPAGFTEDKRDGVIRCHFPKKLSEEQFAAYHKAALDNLYLWAQNLPVFDEKAAREQEGLEKRNVRNEKQSGREQERRYVYDTKKNGSSIEPFFLYVSKLCIYKFILL
jgi:hypothetical protein